MRQKYCDGRSTGFAMFQPNQQQISPFKTQEAWNGPSLNAVDSHGDVVLLVDIDEWARPRGQKSMPFVTDAQASSGIGHIARLMRVQGYRAFKQGKEHIVSRHKELVTHSACFKQRNWL